MHRILGSGFYAWPVIRMLGRFHVTVTTCVAHNAQHGKRKLILFVVIYQRFAWRVISEVLNARRFLKCACETDAKASRAWIYECSGWMGRAFNSVC